MYFRKTLKNKDFFKKAVDFTKKQVYTNSELNDDTRREWNPVPLFLVVKCIEKGRAHVKKRFL